MGKSITMPHFHVLALAFPSPPGAWEAHFPTTNFNKNRRHISLVWTTKDIWKSSYSWLSLC